MSFGELTSISVRGPGFQRVYDPAALPVCDPRGTLLESFAQYSHAYFDWDTTHAEIATALDAPSGGARSVIVLRELLDESHLDDEHYVVMHEERIVSLLRETVFRHFDRQINTEMSDWLADHNDPADTHLEKVIRSYEHKALQILKAECNEGGEPYDPVAARKPRTETRRERHYLLPEPFSCWDDRNPYQQYYFLEGPKTFALGGPGGSSGRRNHTVFGLAFAAHDSRRPVPTCILVYDRHNRIKLVDTLARLCLVQRDLGSNYDLDHARVKELTFQVLLCDWE